jgi:hypothetical protein
MSTIKVDNIDSKDSTGNITFARPIVATLQDASVTDAKIADMSATKLTGTINNARISLDAAEIPSLATSKITSGTFDNARISAASVTQHVPPVDLTAVRQDIAILALYSATTDNKAAYNLPNSFIDHFEDSAGVTTTTDVGNIGEYFTSISGGGDDTYTKMLLHMEDTALSNTASSTTVAPASTGGGVSRSSVQKKFGTYSMRNTGTSGLHFTYDSAWMAWGSQIWTMDFWIRLDNMATNNQTFFSGETDGQYVGSRIWTTTFSYPNSYNSTWGDEVGTKNNYVNNTWYHVAHVYDGSTIKCYVDGTLDATRSATGSAVTGSRLSIFGDWGAGNTWYPTGYMDEFRISMGITRWTADFSGALPTAAYSPLVVNPTGTLVSDTQTVPVAITKMSGVILIKEGGSSTTVMDNHLTISFSATNGTGNDWVDVTTYTAVTAPFSTGITMIKLSETTVPSGTSPTIRAKWAGQTSGGFETQLHGWAMNY